MLFHECPTNPILGQGPAVLVVGLVLIIHSENNIGKGCRFVTSDSLGDFDPATLLFDRSVPTAFPFVRFILGPVSQRLPNLLQLLLSGDDNKTCLSWGLQRLEEPRFLSQILKNRLHSNVLVKTRPLVSFHLLLVLSDDRPISLVPTP